MQQSIYQTISRIQSLVVGELTYDISSRVSCYSVELRIFLQLTLAWTNTIDIYETLAEYLYAGFKFYGCLSPNLPFHAAALLNVNVSGRILTTSPYFSWSSLTLWGWLPL